MKRTLIDFGVKKSNKKANQNTDLQITTSRKYHAVLWNPTH